MFALYFVNKKERNEKVVICFMNIVYNLLCNVLAVSLIAEGNIEYITSAKTYHYTS